MRQQEAEIISSVLQRVWFLLDYFLIFDSVQRAESGLSSVSGLSVTYRQLNTQSTVRSGDSGTVIESATVTDPSVDLILVTVLL